MVNILHVQGEDGEVIHVNAAELKTEEGKEWLDGELDKHRVGAHEQVREVYDEDKEKR